MIDLPRSEFVAGAQAMREMLSRFVEQGGDAITAQSMRLNWNPAWGDDPGMAPEGEFSRVGLDKTTLNALRAANVDGRFSLAISEAEKMIDSPVLIFTPMKSLIQEQAEMQHDQAAFDGGV